MDNEIIQRARIALLQRLESLQRAGVETLVRSDPLVIETGSNQQVSHSNPPSTEQLVGTNATSREKASDPVTQETADTDQQSLFRSDDNAPPILSLEERQEQLKILNDQVCDCTLCDELAATRTQTVFGVGNVETRLLFFGEAPGADEDRQGEPFVGRAGQLLDKIIEACTLQRSQIYILNVLKCRPPGNRNPSPEETTNCRPFFERQLEIIRPDFICCLGSIAAQTLLETKLSIGKLRGELHPYKWAKVLATYHPAYLLRNPSAKKLVWEDMQLLMNEMGIELPAKT